MCVPTQALCVCVPRQPGHLSGRVLTRSFSCGPPVCYARQLGFRAAFLCSQSRGRGGRGARGRCCCGEFSNLPLSASIFFFFLRNSSYSSPPGPNKHLAAHTAQPGSLPRILQQTLPPGRGLQAPWSLCWSQGPYCP